MFFILSKLLTFIIHPFIWILALFIGSLISKKPNRKKYLFIAGLVFCFLFSNQFIYNEVALVWEHQIPSQIAHHKNYGVAIVMGGIAGTDIENDLYSFNKNAERLLNVLPYYFENKVDKILIAGGSGKLFQGEKEAEVIQKYLLSVGVDQRDILLDTNSRNTHENALYTSKIIAEKDLKGPFLLSTSAVHMPRSFACFQKKGIPVVPYPVDYTGKKSYDLGLILFPKPEVISYWYWLIHEWVGMLSYRLMGYC